ncbi:MAG: Na(+)-translocating NADH-quinone reductase subunit A [Bacteroidia bacterium]
MTSTIKLRRGFDIKLEGQAKKENCVAVHTQTVSINPPAFRYSTFKLLVDVGTEVQVGTPLLYDKKHPSVVVSSPVSGEVVAVHRGDRRVLQEIVILADQQQKHIEFGPLNLDSMDATTLRTSLQQAGLWPLIRRRPFDCIALPDENPIGIFVSGFDSAPLAPSVDFLIKGHEQAFQAGLHLLTRLSQAPVHLGIHAAQTQSAALLKAEKVQIHRFEGAHPAGNVGIQMHHIRPVNKGEAAWYVHPSDVVILGRFVLNGRCDFRRRIALTGSELIEPRYVDTFLGASVQSITAGEFSGKKDVRLISGNVLTGTKVNSEGHLGYYDHQLTAIPEGNDLEFLGWLLPSYPRPDISRSFLSGWLKNRVYQVNTNTHGEERAFVVTGQYEQVLPMDIHPTYLLKSIMYQDIEEMEQLGIYEVSEEDFALCEFVCTSKIPVQKIIREGLDLMYEDSMA